MKKYILLSSRSPRSKCPQNWFLVKPSSWLVDNHFWLDLTWTFLCAWRWLFHVSPSFYNDIDSIILRRILMTTLHLHFYRPYLQMQLQWILQFQLLIFRGHIFVPNQYIISNKWNVSWKALRIGFYEFYVLYLHMRRLMEN
jgi:hypothetical protein